jgi:hypothetical protein
MCRQFQPKYVTVQVGLVWRGAAPPGMALGPVCAAKPRTPAPKPGVRGPLTPAPRLTPARLNGYRNIVYAGSALLPENHVLCTPDLEQSGSAVYAVVHGFS